MICVEGVTCKTESRILQIVTNTKTAYRILGLFRLNAHGCRENICDNICPFNLIGVEGCFTWNGEWTKTTGMYWEVNCRLPNDLHLCAASIYLHLITFIDVQESTIDLYSFLQYKYTLSLSNL